MSEGSTSPGAPVIDWWVDGGGEQQWIFRSIGDNLGYYEIINQNSGQCLTTDAVAGDQVYQWPCDPLYASQEWSTPLTTGTLSYYPIQSRDSGLYLDVNGGSPWPGASIDTWYWNGGAGQTFGTL